MMEYKYLPKNSFHYFLNVRRHNSRRDAFFFILGGKKEDSYPS